MKKLFALALAITAAAAIVWAQATIPVTKYVSADDGSVALLIRYVGSGTSATVANVQGTSMTFQVAAAAYTGFECPVSGDLGGIIDLTNGSCDTLGEVVDAINGNCTGCSSAFRAVIVDGLRTDSSADFLASSAVQATRVDGLPIYFDTSANFAVGEGRALLPGDCRTNMKCWLGGPPNFRLLENPHANQQTVVTWVEGYSTYSTGTSALNVYSVKPSNKTAGSESVSTIWNEVMGATATNKQFTQFQYTPLLGGLSEKVVVRITNSAEQSSARLLAAGYQKPTH